jgi:hypothetical protein
MIPGTVRRDVNRSHSLWRHLVACCLLGLYLLILPLSASAGPIPYIPVNTGQVSAGCGAGAAPSGASGDAHIDSNSNQYYCVVHGRQEPPKPLATRILEFGEGFAKGLVDGLWQQITGFWGLIEHYHSLLKFGETLATHPERTLEELKAALGQQGAHVLQSLTPAKLKQELLCEPYSSGKIAGNTVETVVSLLVPVGGEAADAGKAAEELDEITLMVDDGTTDAEKTGQISLCLIPGAAGAMDCVPGDGEGLALRFDDAKTSGEEIAEGKPVLYEKPVDTLTNKVVGDLGEGYIAGELRKADYTDIVYLQNSSGHGVDVIAHNPKTGKTMVYEVKSTRLEDKNTLVLSEAQDKGGEAYVKSRIETLGTQKRKGAVSKEDIDKVNKWLKNKENVEYKKTLVRISKGPNNELRAEKVIDVPWLKGTK